MRFRIRESFRLYRVKYRPHSKASSHHSVFYRRSIKRRLFLEWLVTWSWWLTSLFPLVYLIWYLGQSDSDPTAYIGTLRLKKDIVFPALAGVCSGVGAIVSIFLPLTLHQFNITSPTPDEKPEDQFRRQWLNRLQRVTKLNVFMTIVVLLGTTVLVLWSLGEVDSTILGFPRNVDLWVTYLALSALVFGLTCFFLQLLTLGVAESGNLDRVGHGNLLQGVPWYSYIRRMLVILVSETALSLILGVAILFVLDSRLRDQLHELIFDFCLVVWLPLLLATLYTLLTSRRYRNMWRDRFLKKWGARAGLGLVCNFALSNESPRSLTEEPATKKILLNRQEQEPFRGMWLLPGGYINPREGDKNLHETVRRRLMKLTGMPKKQFVVKEKDVLASPATMARPQVRGWLEKVAKRLSSGTQPRQGGIARLRNRIAKKLSYWSKQEVMDFTPGYSEAVLAYSHAPTDTYLYRVTNVRGEAFREEDIVTSAHSGLRWWPLVEIETTSEIPAHLKELLLCVVENRPAELWSLRRRRVSGGPNAH